MGEIYFATTNEGKVHRLNSALSPHGIEVTRLALEIPEIQSPDLKVIAGDKVSRAYRHIHRPCIAVDSGFYIDALNGFPGPSSRFTLDTIGIEGILKLVEGKPRDACFINCLAYLDSSLEKPMYFESQAKGIITESARANRGEGRNWSELQTIFIPDGQIKTEAEMTQREYDAWRKIRDKVSFSIQFAEWFSKNKSF